MLSRIIIASLALFALIGLVTATFHRDQRVFVDNNYAASGGQCPPCPCGYGDGYGPVLPNRPGGYYGQNIGYGSQAGGSYAQAGSYGSSSGIVAGGY